MRCLQIPERSMRSGVPGTSLTRPVLDARWTQQTLEGRGCIQDGPAHEPAPEAVDYFPGRICSMRFFIEREGGLEAALAELPDLGVGAGLLAAEIVGGEGQQLEAAPLEVVNAHGAGI
jgi:hypothetical protein